MRRTLKRIQLLSAAFILLLLSYCGNKKANILSKEDMQSVLHDLIEADEYVTNYVLKDSTKKESTERIQRYRQVLELHKIDSASFRASYDYYASRPDISKALFDSISRQTSRANRELDSILSRKKQLPKK